ncbi:c-type cytochrome biogenesis protein CcmI [Alteromonas sediminis]|uniref:C-type cytochrome biogenesis protein CcmI n=1 Tax=Alteromonas sediminis TaxID=2259342 RepID=A0A3N5YQC3_9ALTE|nr:c-type cytochrome biogenesis protein CcmI [Alteromonas sediminis]RPJ68281.1 c-type cytochrome biogenesis protein CcmI [Alteromonas sediminis]
MSLGEFYALAAAFVVLAIVIIVLPLTLARSSKARDALTNAQLVKGRLQEIEREVAEGVLGKEDKANAEKEVKLALVDERQETKALSSVSVGVMLFGALVAISVGAWVYANVNHLDGVMDAAQAPENLQSLSAKLLDPELAQTIQPDDIQQLALALRLRLRDEPEDAQGWMFLGRLRVTLGQLEESVAAYERSLQLRPDNTPTRVSYAQALMMTNQEASLKKAQNELSALLAQSPDNDNLALMMAVTSAQLGDAEIAQANFDKIKDKLAPDNPMRQTLEQRLAELGGVAKADQDNRALEITVDIAEALRGQVPESGFLVVFARSGEAKQGMPIAVKRQAITGFPITLTLSDSDAMLPELTLFNFDAVNLTARISNTPDVSAQAGDLEGNLVITSIATGPNSYTIEINKEIQ